MSVTDTSEYIPSATTTLSTTQSWSRAAVLRLLRSLEQGQLIIREDDQKLVFGRDSSLRATIRVNDPSFYTRVLSGGSIGAAEAFIDGLWNCDDLTAVIRIMVVNQSLLDRLEQKLAWLLWPLRRLQHLRRSNSRTGAKKNILAHYDLGNDMYSRFLDPTMMYSSAIYPKPDSTLEEASLNKLDIICRRLKLQPGDRVIEIGSGWGGFAIHAARNYGCHVTTTTISDAQHQEARRRIDTAGLSDQITLLKQDYRDLEGTFDKLVSIEMIEAVGDRWLPGFISTCSNLLKDDGIMLIQAITIRDQLHHRYLKGVDFIQKHIFPGGCLLSNQRLANLITDCSDMVIRSIDDYGFDYARTLNDWRKRFLAAFDSLRDLGYDERFKKLWEYYFCYCEGGFLERAISVIQLTATKPQHRDNVGRL